MHNLQAAFFDVDGTIFDYHDKKIHDSTIRAIKRLHEQGVIIVIASGRSYPLLGEECLTKIPADYYITANGHSIQDSSARVLYSSRFSYEQAERVVALARKYDCGLLLKYPTCSYLYNRPDEMLKVFSDIGLSQDTFRFCTEMDFHNQELPLGFTIRGCDEMKEALKKYSADYRIELFFDVTECDVFNPRINKFTAIHYLAETLNLQPDRCIAFGDSRNDIEMIRWVGKGIAMGNACDDLKCVADDICGNSWEDGIANYIASHC